MISVIIPTYERAEYIDRAIKSVLMQNDVEFELIVVDDNNPDSIARKEMQKKMKKYENLKNFHYIQHEKNLNGAAARNTGIKIAKGEYITFLDDDDYFLPNRLYKLQEALEKNKEANFAFSNVAAIDGKTISILDKKDLSNLQFKLLKQKSFFSTGSNLFFRAKSLKELNGFDEKFRRNQDLEVMVRFLNNNSVCKVDECLVVKDEADRKNVPNIAKIYEIKHQYLKKFENEVNKYNKNEIYLENLYSTLSLAYSIKSKEYDIIKRIKKEAKEYGDFTIKMKLKLAYYKLFKKRIFRISKKVDEKIKKVIMEYYYV